MVNALGYGGYDAQFDSRLGYVLFLAKFNIPLFASVDDHHNCFCCRFHVFANYYFVLLRLQLKKVIRNCQNIGSRFTFNFSFLQLEDHPHRLRIKLGQQQCDQIGRFIGLWATFQSLWQQLISSEIIFGQLL